MPDKKPVDQAKAESLRKWAEVMQDPRNDLLHKISHVLLDVDLMKDVEDAISSRITDSTSEAARDMWHKILDRYERGHFASLVKEVADQTGAFGANTNARGCYEVITGKADAADVIQATNQGLCVKGLIL